MRILVDRHHADLLYSLQLLFEDRLGIDVWIPVGHEWWDEGYWQFGKVFGDDRLAQQYLIPHDGIWRLTNDGWYSTTDTAHPEREIRGVTLDDAREMDFDFVMPTVQENQQGFARFARESGARYLYQIGNTGQQIDWTLDPLVLNTSEAPVPEGRGITIHQEIESGAHGIYRYWPLAPLNVVRNFVNAFDRLPGWQKFLDVEQALPEFEFTTHGHAGRDGFISPAPKQAAMMADAGWGWHDKPVGDGFGHVIHAWAAVGRPLIGTAAYYRNKLAAPFWTPSTSIDIEGLSPDEIARRVRAVGTEQHAEMCAAIRATFDRLVNYEAEADAVRALLGL